MKQKNSKRKRSLVSGVIHVEATFNNTLISLTDLRGDVVAWSSAGTAGFSGARKSTPFAAQMAAESIGEKAKNMGVKSVEVCVKGPGSGRESALRALRGVFSITIVRDVTGVPHNGCRLPKRRRV